jgi:hypothetical protein
MHRQAMLDMGTAFGLYLAGCLDALLPLNSAALRWACKGAGKFIVNIAKTLPTP